MLFAPTAARPRRDLARGRTRFRRAHELSTRLDRRASTAGELPLALAALPAGPAISPAPCQGGRRPRFAIETAPAHGFERAAPRLQLDEQASPRALRSLQVP